MHKYFTFEVGIDNDGNIVPSEVQDSEGLNAPEGIFTNIRNIGADLEEKVIRILT